MLCLQRCPEPQAPASLLLETKSYLLAGPQCIAQQAGGVGNQPQKRCTGKQREDYVEGNRASGAGIQAAFTQEQFCKHPAE